MLLLVVSKRICFPTTYSEMGMVWSIGMNIVWFDMVRPAKQLSRAPFARQTGFLGLVSIEKPHPTKPNHKSSQSPLVLAGVQNHFVFNKLKRKDRDDQKRPFLANQFFLDAFLRISRGVKAFIPVSHTKYDKRQKLTLAVSKSHVTNPSLKILGLDP